MTCPFIENTEESCNKLAYTVRQAHEDDSRLLTNITTHNIKVTTKSMTSGIKDTRCEAQYMEQ